MHDLPISSRKNVHFDVMDDDARAARKLLRLICSASPEPDSLEFAKNLLLARSERRHFFECEIFGDPAWDMLLMLFIASKDRHKLSVTSLIFAVDIPQTTGLRWIRVLEQAGLACRNPSPDDRRRIYVELTPSGEEKMKAYFDRLGHLARWSTS